MSHARSKAFLHLTARAWPGLTVLASVDAGNTLFHWLRRRWPDALAACIMPDHVHLIVYAEPAVARVQFHDVLRPFARHCARRRLWQPIPEPTPISNRAHLQRSIRYVHLNPSRAGLCPDPLSWPWSTHRGAIGAEYDAWVRPRTLAEALARPTKDFPQWLHGYVSADPTVDHRGTPFPRAAQPTLVPQRALSTVIAAAVATMPTTTKFRARSHIFVHLAHHQGYRDARQVALAAGVEPRSVRRLLARRLPDGMFEAALLCLGDPRLRFHAPTRLDGQWEIELSSRRGAGASAPSRVAPSVPI